MLVMDQFRRCWALPVARSLMALGALGRPLLLLTLSLSVASATRPPCSRTAFL